MLFNIYLAVLFICFITGVVSVYYNRKAPLYLKLFPWFILITFVVEKVAIYLAYTTRNNNAVYNFYSILEFAFFVFLIYNCIQNKRIRRVIVFTACLFLPFMLANIFFIKGIHHFETITFLPGSGLLILFSSACLYELFFKSSVKTPFKEPAFWIAVGILLFRSCTAPLFLVQGFGKQFTFKQLLLIGQFIIIINLIYYSLFTIAFLCNLKLGKTDYLV
jgi:hypothetical protein